MKISGKLVDIFKNEIYSAEICIEEGIIVSIRPISTRGDSFLLPGLIDSHIHIESSMVTPQNFGRIALSHGTVATVSDPHEIANVLGFDGVKYMMDNASGSPLKFFFGAPSCVPATIFESSGANLTANDIETLFKENRKFFLSEVMNYPGVINNEKEVIIKIELAKKYRRRIDGHAPGLSGKFLQAYIDAGIETDHECSTLDEALEKITKGMIIQIREGSAAKNFDALWTLIDSYPNNIFLCSDDLHPEDLIKGHINLLLKRGVHKGVNIFNLLRTVTINPSDHYNLGIGQLRVGDSADFIVVDDLISFEVSKTYIHGKKVFDRKVGLVNCPEQRIQNNFNAKKITEQSLIIPDRNKRVKVISVEDGELVTKMIFARLKGDTDLGSDVQQDILKLVVLNRYKNEPAALGYIHNFNLKRGAIASSIAHDSHNIISTGVSNREICECINWVISNSGGIAIHDGNKVFGLPLPIAGIISDKSTEEVSEKYIEINTIARNLGCSLRAPFMTLSFMALLVIPELKLSDKGLFDGIKFEITSLYED